jgi:hypothetical protein
MLSKQAELLIQNCNNCGKEFSYKKKDYYRREYPHTCTYCIQHYLNRPNPAEKHSCTRYKHGHTFSGKKTKIYRLWATIRERCNNPNSRVYKFYGAKGIKVCERWNDFKQFKVDVEIRGYKEGYSIIRIDKTKDYNPDNIRIFHGKGTAKVHFYKGMHLTLSILHRYATNGIKLRGLQKRLILGYTIEEALHLPLKGSKNGHT